MSKPVVLITGSNGFIGEAAARALGSDYHTLGVDIEEPSDDTPLDEVRHMDLTSDVSVSQTADHIREHHDGRLASVVHLAAYYDFSGEPSPLYDEITVEGTRRLLEHLRPLEVGQLLFSSTMLVHAPVEPGGCIDEEAPLEAKWAYPESKLRTEELIRRERGGIPTVFLRLAGVYADWGQQPTLVQQIKRIHAQDFESFFFPGDSDAGQSLLHLEDAADAVRRAVDRRDRLGPEEPILVGEPDPPSYAELQDAIGEAVWGTEWPTIRMPEPLAEAGAWLQEKNPLDEPFIKPFMIELADDHYGLDIGRAQRRLGWSPEHRLLDELPAMVAAMKDDPEGWYERNGLEMPEGAPATLGPEA